MHCVNKLVGMCFHPFPVYITNISIISSSTEYTLSIYPSMIPLVTDLVEDDIALHIVKFSNGKGAIRVF